jgi:hypothetical protein
VSRHGSLLQRAICRVLAFTARVVDPATSLAFPPPPNAGGGQWFFGTSHPTLSR